MFQAKAGEFSERQGAVETCDLAIIGAGLAGLNALYVAQDCLGRDARVVLIDRHSGPGGMWTETYGHCRLHQPHESFTVGDMAWDWDRPRDYLAAGAEVLAHLEGCYDRIRADMAVRGWWGHEVRDCREVETPEGLRVAVRCTGPGGVERDLSAARVIDATGLDISAPEALALSSDAVRSVAPGGVEALGGEVPAIYVIGGGKTGIDTCLAAMDASPLCPVTLINGKGTVFANRDRSLPRGHRRWWAGRLVMSSFADIALRFDGCNEAAVSAYFRDTYAISPGGCGEQFFFGFLSEAERDAVEAGLAGAIGDYLEDVVDGPKGPEMRFRSGTHKPVAPGSVFINCTGHILRKSGAYRPYLSHRGAILSITPRSTVHFQSGVAAYVLSHLFLRGRLADAPLYELDLEEAMRHGRELWHMVTVTASYMNMLVILGLLPMRVMDRCGLDIDRWFPLHRRLGGLIRVILMRRRHVARCRAALDRVRLRCGLRCGPLER